MPLELIADEIGTPVYVYSAATLRRHARVLKDALAGLGDPLIAYAVKANPNPAVFPFWLAKGWAPTSSRSANIAPHGRPG